MTKQRNYVAKNDFNKGCVHKDKSKTIPREEKYPNTIEVDEEDIKVFVKGLYKDGKTPCERFGMTWEVLGEIENKIFYDKFHEAVEEKMEEINNGKQVEFVRIDNENN